MNTNETAREQISAFADGELTDAQLDSAFAALRGADAKADWDLYHRIGDVLRSDEIGDTALSANFSARFAARLDAEPTIIAPAAVLAAQPRVAKRSGARRWAIPGFAAAAGMAGVAFFATPQLMVASADRAPTAITLSAPPAGKQAQDPVVAATVSNGVVVRDARIEEYMMAHRRFAPSPYSTAQYAGSTPPATEPGKQPK